VALIDGDDAVGRLTLTTAEEPDACCSDRLTRTAALLARMIAADGRAGGNLTDPATGLPNAGYLRRALARLVPACEHSAAGFGLIALHVRDLGRLTERRGKDSADRFLRTVARRLAAACDEGETALRLGPDQFIVLTGENRGGELVRRWHALVEQLGRDPIELDGGGETVRLDAAHVANPLDGDRLDVLLAALESRLTGSTAATILPFRDRRAG
jgi:diguanylate cyclase (GGDEF)-like protein